MQLYGGCDAKAFASWSYGSASSEARVAGADSVHFLTSRRREGKSQVTLIKSAEDWLKQTADGIRADRFAPIAEETKAVWAKLRHRSNVDLENIVLSGAKTNRRVDLEVTVDGVEGAALGVMSQGELHALALSLFLPRAMLAESPFRFVVIDDPVQSMDPARVDGLAHTLADAARTRQVVVFTHDDRLPEAVRRMQLEATVISVTRRPGSVVECRPSRNPIEAHLADAYALAKDTDLPIAAQARVIPGLCRSALEAFFVDVVRRRRINKGQSHAEVEDDLAASHTLNKRAALALFDDVERAGEVMGRLNKQLGIVRLIRLDPKNLQSRTIRLQVDATRPGRRLGLV